MNYVRSIDPGLFKPDDYSLQILSILESSLFMGVRTPPRNAHTSQHTHDSDQYYYIVKGTMIVQLGSELFTAGPDSVVFIPAGVPHHNWNETDEEIIHLEIITPMPSPLKPGLTRTESTDAGGKPYFVHTLTDDVKRTKIATKDALEWTTVPDDISLRDRSANGGMKSYRLAARANGSPNFIYVATVQPGDAGPAMHVHDFDQFYFILESELSIEVGLKRYSAKPGSLVVLPAGVPHRQWNESDQAERHVTVLLPQPPNMDTAWDSLVRFEKVGEVH